MAPPLPTRVRVTPESGTPGDARPPLPEDPAALPPVGAEFEAVVAAAAGVLGIELSEGQRAALEVHVRLLQAWNAQLNLTALRTPARIAAGHVADSLTAVPLLRRLAPPGATLLDLGSGGGFPGLALGVALPARRVGLVDSVGKKARFLVVAARAVQDVLAAAGEAAPEIAVHAVRAEMLGHDASQRGTWDVLTGRALGSLAELVELGLPLLREGGHLLAWKRDRPGSPALAAELAAAGQLIAAAGGGRPVMERAVPDPCPHVLAELRDHRLVIVRKIRTTPRRYPRSPTERRRLLR